jgi:hypothetical protein
MGVTVHSHAFFTALLQCKAFRSIGPLPISQAEFPAAQHGITCKLKLLSRLAQKFTLACILSDRKFSKMHNCQNDKPDPESFNKSHLDSLKMERTGVEPRFKSMFDEVIDGVIILLGEMGDIKVRLFYFLTPPPSLSLMKMK